MRASERCKMLWLSMVSGWSRSTGVMNSPVGEPLKMAIQARDYVLARDR